MTDDELRAALRLGHADDRPPTFEATLAAAHDRPRRRRWLVPAFGATLAAAIAALVLLRCTPSGAPPAIDLAGIGMASSSLRLPTDSLLDVPDRGLLASTPHLDQGLVP